MTYLNGNWAMKEKPLVTEREKLEQFALDICSSEEYYDLLNTVKQKTAAQLTAIIKEGICQ
jgi:hypothetical protein